MIKSFADKLTEELYNTGHSLKYKSIERVALRKLDIIEAAVNVNILRIPPANHLELLKGDREGQYSIRINDQFRICFKWEGQYAIDVEITDYH